MYVVCDIETNDKDISNVNRIHCMSMNWGGEIRSTTDYNKMRDLVSRNDITLVGHYFAVYDVPVLEKILGVRVKCNIIDTVSVGWYLYPEREDQKLESWGEEFGVPKPVIDDWENLTQEQYIYRCEEDVKINTILWEKQLTDLNQVYDNQAIIDSLLRYLSFKMYTVRLQEQSPFKLDINRAKDNLAKLELLRDEKLSVLKSVMPSVGAVTYKSRPKNLYKSDGSLNTYGVAWKNLCLQNGLDYTTHTEPIKVIKDYVEPNPQSPSQVKDWLFSLGWKPQTFKKGANGKVPQINKKVGDETMLCPSVKKLIDKHPDVEHLDSLGVLKHRIGLLKGFLRDNKDGYIACYARGFASTLRMRHGGIVNLPKPNLPYGEFIRGVLTCDEGYELCDSDLASLENMIKLDLIYPLNPDKVKKELTPDYDSHLDMAVTAKLMTEEDMAWFKAQKELKVKEDPHRYEVLSSIRHKAKTTNYSAQYGVGKASLAENLEIKQSEAQMLLDGYWKQNKEVKIVAARFETKKALGKTWILNPYNKFWYELRSEKDRFSAVVQSAGDFICYLWTKKVLEKREQLTMVYHDQIDLIVELGNRPEIEKILKDSIEEVNKILKLRVPMKVSVNFGKYLSEVH